MEIFCSPVASLRDRIMYAAIVVHFLGIWHNHVTITKGLTVQKHFLSRQTYLDVLLSAHFAVILICYMRDCSFPEAECRLDLTGTDVVETYFSSNGQWVGNQHTYSFARLEQNLSHMVRLEEIRAKPDSPDFAKPHAKSEVIWPKQHMSSKVHVDLKAYPKPGEEIEAWKEGIVKAQALATDVGMTPKEGESEDWFYHPFRFTGNDIGQHQTAHFDTDDDSDSHGSGYEGIHTCIYNQKLKFL